MIFLKDGKYRYSVGGSLPDGAMPISLEDFMALPENRAAAAPEANAIAPGKTFEVTAEVERFHQEQTRRGLK